MFLSMLELFGIDISGKRQRQPGGGGEKEEGEGRRPIIVNITIKVGIIIILLRLLAFSSIFCYLRGIVLFDDLDACGSNFVSYFSFNLIM